MLSYKSGGQSGNAHHHHKPLTEVAHSTTQLTLVCVDYEQQDRQGALGRSPVEVGRRDRLRCAPDEPTRQSPVQLYYQSLH